MLVGGDVKYQPWALYGALKLSYSPMTDVTLFTKAGVGYYSVKQTSTPAAAGDGSSSNFGPMFAVGMAYDIMDNLSANVTFTRLAGNDDFAGATGTSEKFSTSPNLITVGVAYTFPM